MAQNQPQQAALVESLEQVAQGLAKSTAQMQQAIQQMSGPGEMAASPAPPAAASEARDQPANATRSTAPPAKKSALQEATRFYERLEQAGQLMDVDEKTDLSTLPSRVTHVRRPDGTVQRIGFSESPFKE